MSGNEHTLNAYIGKNNIATITLRDDQLYWQYDKTWQHSGYPVSPHLPLQGEIPSLNVQRFLRNMLPEGDILEELLNTFHISRSNTFGLVRLLGLDMSGAIVMIAPPQSLPDHAFFRLIKQEELIQRLDEREENSLIIWDDKPRLSVAGIQEKINIVLNDDKQIGFGEGGLCSTHILKFEKLKLSHLVLNEYITMKLAHHCGLLVAKADLLQFGKHRVLLIERFDRRRVSALEVKRRHMIDGCQALNFPPEYKYERNFGSARDVSHIRDGVSLKQLFDLTNHCVLPAQAKQHILDWVIFNILIFNFDAHGKNISFFVGHDGLTVTPFYDLVNIKMYPQFEQSMSMALGDEFNGDAIHAYELASFADSCSIPRTFVVNRLKFLINNLTHALVGVMQQVDMNHEEQRFFTEYHNMVSQHCKHLKNQAELIMGVQV